MRKRIPFLIIALLCVAFAVVCILAILNQNSENNVFLMRFTQLTFLLYAIGGSVLWIYALVKAIQNKVISESEKICWVLAIIFLNLLGGLLFLCFGNKKSSSNSMGFVRPKM